MGCFAMVQFRKRIVGCYFNNTMMHENLYGDKDLDRRYGEQVILVSVMEL